ARLSRACPEPPAPPAADGARQCARDRADRCRPRCDRCRTSGRDHAAQGQGGAAVAHLDAKLTAREAIHGLPDGEIRIVAIATETASALFVAGTYGGASGRLTGLSWGAEDLSADLGAETNRDAEGRFTEPFRFARNLCLAAAAAAKIQAIDTVFVDFRDLAG